MKWLRLILVVSIFFLGHTAEAKPKYQELELKGPVKEVQVATYDQTTHWWAFSDYLFSKENKLLGTVSYQRDGNIVTFYNNQDEPTISITGSENKVAKGGVQHVDRKINPPTAGESYTLLADGTFKKVDKPNEYGRMVKITEISAAKDQIAQLQVITYDETSREIKNEYFTWVGDNQSNYKKNEYSYDLGMKTGTNTENINRKSSSQEINTIEETTIPEKSSVTYGAIDSMGNWLTRQIFLNGKEMKFEKRIITYHEDSVEKY